MLTLTVNLGEQTLTGHNGAGEVCRYAVSTAALGAGQERDSECTPLGLHIVWARIGAGVPANTVFVGRQPTGEIYTGELGNAHPDRDWILTRVLWLAGLEDNHNRLGNVDTLQRYIYIHGAPDDTPMGKPGSHGCIRMRNDDLIALFEKVSVGTHVSIVAGCE